MSMNLKCPKCLYAFDPREATRNQDIIAVIKMQADFAQHSKLVFEYAELFETTRPVKPAKLLRILSEFRDIWLSGRFGMNKRVHVISREGMVQALKTICGKTFGAPLENHNYIKKVMVSISEAEAAKRSAAEEKALKENEAAIRRSAQPENLDNFERPASIGDAVNKVPWRK